MCHAGAWIAMLALLLAACSTPPVRTTSEEQLLRACVQPAAPTDAGLPGSVPVALASRSTMPTRFPDAARVLGLSPEETIMLFDIIAAQQGQPMRIGPDGVLWMSDDAMRETSARLAGRDNCIRALLGKRFPRWAPYNATLPLRVQVHRLRTLLDATRRPISDERAESLIAALAANQAEGQPGAPVVTPGIRGIDAATNAQFLAERNRRLLAVAGDWLDTTQLDIFRQMVEEDERTTAGLRQRIQLPRPAPPPEPQAP